MNYLNEWVEFYRSEFPSAASIPPMPKSLEDIKSITVRMTLENYNQGKLFQNLFGNSGLGVALPADVQLRLQRNELLPQDNSTAWAQVNPQGSGTLKDRNFLQAGHHIGINTVGQTLRNANLQLRSEPPNPQVKVSPWIQSTINPDTNRKPLEIGGCA